MAETIFRHELVVDLDKPLKRLDVGDILASGDENADRFEVKLYRGSAEVSAAGMTVAGFFIKPDDVTIKLTGTASGNTVSIVPKKACYVYDGAFSLAVKITGSGLSQTVAIFDGRIVRTTTENIEDGNRVFYSLEDLLLQIEATEAAAQAANSAAHLANQAADNALTASENALTAADNANDAASGANAWANATASASQLPAGSAPTVGVTETGGAKKLTFGIPKGDQGLPFVIKGAAYATLAALQADVTRPAVGDQYNVGAAAPYNVYRWTGSAWEDQGKLGSAAVDATLTHSGQSADAKAVGDALAGKLDKTGGTLTGNVEVNGEAEYRAFRVTRTIDGAVLRGELGVNESGGLWLRLLKDGVVMNSIKLNEAAMVLGTPLPAESGGTGVNSLPALRQMLGVDVETFADSVTYNVAKNFASFRRFGNSVHVNYQSISAEIAQGTVLFTLPEGYRPADRYTSATFVVDGAAFGRILIDNTTGEAKVLRISQTATGVAVVNMHYTTNGYYIVG